MAVDLEGFWVRGMREGRERGGKSRTGAKKKSTNESRYRSEMQSDGSRGLGESFGDKEGALRTKGRGETHAGGERWGRSQSQKGHPWGVQGPGGVVLVLRGLLEHERGSARTNS